MTDSKIIKLFVDDEPFWLTHAHLLKYDRRLNMKSGTLDREVIWQTPAGKQVLITSRRLVSFSNKHVAAISYRVTLLNAGAPVVISSEMAVHRPRADARGRDPRQARVFEGRTLHPRMGYARDRRVVLCHGAEKSGLRLTCAIDHVIETACAHAHKVFLSRGLRPGRLHSRGSAKLPSRTHQIHGLSHVGCGFSRRTLWPG